MAGQEDDVWPCARKGSRALRKIERNGGCGLYEMDRPCVRVYNDSDEEPFGRGPELTKSARTRCVTCTKR